MLRPERRLRLITLEPFPFYSQTAQRQIQECFMKEGSPKNILIEFDETPSLAIQNRGLDFGRAIWIFY